MSTYVGSSERTRAALQVQAALGKEPPPPFTIEPKTKKDVPQLESAKADLVQYLLGSAVPPAELPADLPAKQPPAKQPCAAQRAKRKRLGAEPLQEGDTKKRFCSRAYGAAKVAAQAAGVDPLEPARQAHRQAAEIWDKALLARLALKICFSAAQL